MSAHAHTRKVNWAIDRRRHPIRRFSIRTRDKERNQRERERERERNGSLILQVDQCDRRGGANTVDDRRFEKRRPRVGREGSCVQAARRSDLMDNNDKQIASELHKWTPANGVSSHLNSRPRRGTHTRFWLSNTNHRRGCASSRVASIDFYPPTRRQSFVCVRPNSGHDE